MIIQNNNKIEKNIIHALFSRILFSYSHKCRSNCKKKPQLDNKYGINDVVINHEYERTRNGIERLFVPNK